MFWDDNIFLRTPYNYNTNEVSDETGLKCEDESLAQQNQKEEADINTIVRKFGLTGQLPENVRVPQYGDFTGITDYRSALHIVMEANDAFMQMSPEIRKRFGNDPAEFVAFCSDSKNLEEMKKMGLAIEKKPADEPTAAPEGRKPDTPPEGGG